MNLLALFVCVFSLSLVVGDYSRQAKILASDAGDLILETAVDRNIVIRLQRDSYLFVNNIDVMERIYQRSPTEGLELSAGELDAITPTQIQENMRIVKDDLLKLIEKSVINQVNASLSSQFKTVRDLWRRLRLLNRRITILKRNILKDDCAKPSPPCKNGGVCFDAYKDFHCECSAGWTGKTCEQDVDECYMFAGSNLGCQNNAKCQNTPGGFSCICAQGYSGTHCRSRSSTCTSSDTFEICAHGTCVPANSPQGYTCVCDQGWTKDNRTIISSAPCSLDIDECDASRNPCHGECINLPGSFRCGPCPSGYTGNGLMCTDIDECATDNGGCSVLPKVKCINTEGSRHCGVCPPGWTGDGFTCSLVPSDSCDAERICHPQAKCQYISEVVTCTCPHGMFGHGFGPDGCHGNMSADPCEGHLCQNGGSCVANARGTSCYCPNGYTGSLCEVADGCHPNPCQNNATCKPLLNQKFHCTCKRGFTGNTCEILRQICGSVIYMREGRLSYPVEDGSTYDNNERCAWIIRTVPQQILNVTFESFDVEQDAECSKDWLQIHDGNSLATQSIGRFCGNELPLGGNFLSSHENLFFWFRSNNATKAKGFSMIWKSQALVCGQQYELAANDMGFIRSPGYPGKTPKNRECEWSLTAPYGYRFAIRIYELNLGTVPNCAGDLLKIYDANLLLQKFCTNVVPEPLYTSSNKALIHFHTDSYAWDSSFQMHYQVEPGSPHCGGVFTESIGYVLIVNVQRMCLYLIQQPMGLRIRLSFAEFKGLRVDNCNLQSLEVFDGKTDQDRRLLKHCSQLRPETITTSGSYALIRYKNIITDLPTETLKIQYSRVCGDKLYGAEYLRVATPNYPQPYPDYVTCTYEIYGPPNTRIYANFTDVDIAEANDAAQCETGFHEWTSASADDGMLDDASITYLDVYPSKKRRLRYCKSTEALLIADNNQMVIVFHAAKNTGRARGFAVHFSFHALKCGGVFSESNSSFNAEVSRAVCEWIIESPPDKHIELKLSYKPKENKTLDIYGVSSMGQEHLLFSISRTVENWKESFYYHTLIIRGPLAPYSIVANITFLSGLQACGGNYTARYGIIKSPFYPETYPPKLDCQWIIQAPLGHQIELRIQNFSIEAICTSDYLEIRNGPFDNSPLIGRYCGNEIPSRLVSYTNSLYLRFISDGYTESSGFHLTWQQTSTGCGGKLSGYRGSIHSPHYIRDDGLREHCNWQIFVAAGSTIRLSIVSTDLEIREFCRQKVLQIYDGPTTLAAVMDCNSTDSIAPGGILKLKSSTNQVLVLYAMASSDNSFAPNAAFILDYETECTTTIDDRAQGVIESPNFPDKYPENLNCQWLIIAGRNNKLKLSFSHLNLANENFECEYDYIELLDMQGEDILRKQRFCNLPNQPFVTGGNRLKVHFVSDYSNSAAGFRAEFTRLGCGEHIYKDYGSIESPALPYSVDVDCEWYIESQPGKRITLNINQVHIETDSQDCSQDSLFVAETKSSSTALLEECDIEKSTLRLVSPSHRLYVHFRTSAKRTRKYFKATFYADESVCGGVLQTNSGFISSPNYPHNYSHPVECIWHVTVADSYVILLEFDDFYIPGSELCTGGNLTIYTLNGTSSISQQVFCGSEKPAIQRIYSNKLRIILHITKQNSVGRFRLHYRKQCGDTILNSFGYLISKVNEKCMWAFMSDEGSQLTLDILQLDCYCHIQPQVKPNVQICRNGLGFMDNVNTVNLTDNHFYTMLTYCDKHPATVNFEVSNLFIFAINVNFVARYSTTQTSCGGTLTSLSGFLASPNYPNPYPSNIECIWNIQATKGNTLEVKFHSMDIRPSAHCNEDYLEVRNSRLAPILALYCSQQLPEAIIRSYETVWLKFHSIDETPGIGNGFKLSWNYALLSEIVNQTGGEIESPPLQSIKNQNEPYTWRIILQRGYFVDMEFQQYTAGLELYDGFDETGLSVDVMLAPWRFISSSNVLFMRSINMNLEYFLIHWKASDNKVAARNSTSRECTSEKLLDRASVLYIQSPNYPAGYAGNLHCQWILKATEASEHVVLNLLFVNLEVMASCSADYLHISTSTDLENWHTVLKICNSTQNPLKYIHGTPYIKLDFVSDETVSGTGFLSMARTHCGANMTDSVGFITSKSYGPCQWHIAVRAGRRINLQLDHENRLLGNDTLECHAYVLVYDGVDDHAALLSPGKICLTLRNTSKLELQSTGHHVLVKYNYKQSLINALMVWNLTYREYSECNSEIKLMHYARNVTISTPNYPNISNPHTDCHWTVIAPVGEQIVVEFVGSFGLSARTCSDEYIEIFDGSTELARLLGRYCSRPPRMHSTGNVLHIHFVTELAEPHNGFQAQLSIAECGGSYGGMRGTITSTGYPFTGTYPSHSRCDYYISVLENARMSIQVKDLHLPYYADNPNASDFLSILPISKEDDVDLQPILLYGNMTEFPVYNIDSYRVRISFYTFATVHNYRGFKILYSRQSLNRLCYQNIFDTGEGSGRFTIHFPRLSFMNNFCQCLIKVSKPQRIRLEFLNMDDLYNFRSSTNSSPTFYIYNDHDSVSEISRFNVDTYNSSYSIESSDNVMLVKVTMPFSKRRQMIPLKFRYTAVGVSSCPSDINADDTSGSIYISENQIEFRKRFYCRLKFVNGNEATTLIFRILQLEFVYKNIHDLSSPLIIRDYTGITRYKRNLTDTLELTQTKPQSYGFVTISRSARHILRTLHLEYQRYQCGGHMHLTDDMIINYPQLSVVETSAVVCIWSLVIRHSITGRSSQLGNYRITGNFSFTDDCNAESIEIYRGSLRNTIPAAIICRDNLLDFKEYVINSFQVHIVYRWRNYRPDTSSFHIDVAKAIVCGSKTIVDRSSNLISVNRRMYTNNMECIWEFETAPGYYLKVAFTDRFFIEYSVNCTNDYLEIQYEEEGLWYPKGRFCGRELPAMQNFSTNHIQIVFRTNEALIGDGFRFEVLADCIFTYNVSSTLQLVRGPQTTAYSYKTNFYGYPNGLQCEYTLLAANESQLFSLHVKFNTNTFSNENNKCSLGTLTSYKLNEDGMETVGEKYCMPDFEIRAYRYLRLVYEINSFHDLRIEFAYDYCGGNITAPSVIRPLRHEDDDLYANNMNCVWYVTAPLEHSIGIRFKYFATEQSFDFVSIYAGHTLQNQKRLAKLSGNYTTNPPTIVVDGHEAVITATSDETQNGIGFEAQIFFYINCNERIALTDGNSPATVARDFKLADLTDEYLCYYSISVPKGYRIRVDVKRIQVNAQDSLPCQHLASTDKCPEDCNYIEIVDSVLQQSQTLGRYCKLADNNRTVISSYEDMKIVFAAHQPGQYNFEIVLSMEQSVCGDTTDYVLKGKEKVVLTFPIVSDYESSLRNTAAKRLSTKYLPNTHCTWYFTGSANIRVHVNFLHLQNASQTNGNCMDYVYFKGLYKSMYMCGDVYDFNVYSMKMRNSISEITFHSDDSIEGYGFQLLITQESECDRVYNELSDLLVYYSQYIEYEHDICSSVIQVPDDYVLSIFVHRAMFISQNCSKIHLKITDITSNSTLLDHCQNLYDNLKLFTNSSQLRLDVGDVNIVEITYVASARGLPAGCGGKLYSSEGIFASPSYDDREFSECRWDIEVPATNLIKLQFEYFDMGAENHCELDHVQVYDVLDDGNERLKSTFCGNERPDSLLSLSNRMAVISRKSPNFVGSGWFIAYSIVNKFESSSVVYF